MYPLKSDPLNGASNDFWHVKFGHREQVNSNVGVSGPRWKICNRGMNLLLGWHPKRLSQPISGRTMKRISSVRKPMAMGRMTPGKTATS